MSDFIALDWERRQLIGLDAHASKGRVRIRQCFRLSWPEGLDLAEDAQRAGEWLKGELKKLHVHARQVLISLPREEAVVRQLDVPDVPDDELPDLVRLQAETKSSSSVDQLVLDFLPLPRAAEAPGRQVLLVTIAREKIAHLRALMEAAGLEVVSVGISPVGAAELVARAEERQQADANETTLIVARHGRRVEISLMRQRRLLFTHSTQLAGESDETDSRLVLAEIRRSMGALARIDSGIVVTRAWVVGTEDENRALRRLLTEHLDLTVGTMLDPLADSAVSLESGDPSTNHAAYAGPLGMLLAAESPLVPGVDFLNPRQSAPRVDRRKLQLGLAAAGVVLLIGTVYGGVKWRVGQLEADIESRREQVRRLDEAVMTGRPTLEAAAVLRDWDERNVHWLARMLDVNKALPGTERVYLVNYRFSPSAGDTAGHLQAIGFARSRRDVEQLYQRLAERGYSVQPHEIGQSALDAEYPFRFDLDLALR